MSWHVSACWNSEDNRRKLTQLLHAIVDELADMLLLEEGNFALQIIQELVAGGVHLIGQVTPKLRPPRWLR